MKKGIGITIIIVIIAIGASNYYTMNNSSKGNNIKEANIKTVQIESDVYEKEFDAMLAFLNEHSSIIYDENSIRLSGILDGSRRLSSRMPNRKTKVELHDMTNAMIEDTYTEIETYTLTDDIEGIIAQHKYYDYFVFIQTNKPEGDYQLLVKKDYIESEADLLAILKDYEQPEEKSYTKDQLEQMLDIRFSDLSVLNVDEDGINLINFGFTYEDNVQNFEVFYELEKDGNVENATLRITLNGMLMKKVKKQFKTENGIDVAFNDILGDMYQWKSSDYVYELILSNRDGLFSAEDVLAFIDKSNGQLSP